MITPWLLASVASSSAALAAGPELVVVGLHVPGLTGAAADAAATRLTEAFDATGKVDALAPAEVRSRLAGREDLILDSFALGPGRDALREGKILYDRAQPDQAIPVLEQATRQLASGLATSTDVRDLHDALTLLGLANAGLGNEAAARQAFRRSVALNPARQLDAVNYPPQIVALYAEVRSQAAAEPPATLSVRAPAGATLWVDGLQATAGDLPMVPGEHHVLLRGADGTAAFETVTLAAGEKRTFAPTLSARAIGRPAGDNAGRTRQTRDLYRSIGQYTDRDLVLVVGTSGTQVALQVYAPASGNFSKALVSEANNDPIGALVALVPAAAGFLTESGDIRSDRVSPQILPFDISSNAVLTSLLLEPATPGSSPSTTARADRKGAPWYLWAGLGALVAGGGATAAVLLTADGGDTGGNGTITFGPIP